MVMFAVVQPPLPRLARYWLPAGAPCAPAPNESAELKAIEPPPAAAWKTPPPEIVPGGWIAPPPLSTGETISQPRWSSSSKTLLGSWVANGRATL